MSQKMKDAISFSHKLIAEYLRAKKLIVAKFKKQIAPNDAKEFITTTIKDVTARQSRIIAQYLIKSFAVGAKEAEQELKGAKIEAAAAPIASVAFDLNSISDSHLKQITRHHIGRIGAFNVDLTKNLISQYDTLLSDNKLSNSLKQHGWTPWLGDALKQKGIDPKVIALIKDQTTTAKMLQLLNQEGIKGGMHNEQVAKRLLPHIQRYFGPGGVTIDNIGKKTKRFAVDASGNFEWKEHIITKKYHTTAQNYSRLIARNSIKDAHREAYYNTLKGSKLVDHFISVSVMSANTCPNCAMMHGRRVTHAEGPSYHPLCYCDLKPVWKKTSILFDKNRSESFYAKQRNMYFLRSNDLRKFNETMPRGSKLSFFSLLPDSALTQKMPTVLKMNAIKNTILGNPAKIAPPPPSIPMKERPEWGMSDDEWRAEANTLYAKTAKDGNEHLRFFNGKLSEFTGTKNKVSYISPLKDHISLHTHPSWDAPLSPQDMISHLLTPKEKVAAATSSKHIYIVRKTPGYTRIYKKAEQKAFVKAYEDERRRLVKQVKGSVTEKDSTEISLKAGQMMAKKFGMEYKVIER